jgi:thiamine biosynthesis protein ThiS
LTCRVSARYAPKQLRHGAAKATPYRFLVQITLNGERFELDRPVSVADLLTRLDIDPRRVAVEHNLAILKRQRFPEVLVHEGDTVEIVNFVGGG